MPAHKINVKLFVKNPYERVNLPTLIPIFHRWIREHEIEGLPIDVADYKHVHHGPGMMLIGHEGDYALDMGNGRPGLWYSHKREWGTDDLTTRVQTVLRLALHASQLLTQDPSLDLIFHTNEIELTFTDRLTMPNTPETVTAVSPTLINLFTQLGLNIELAQTYSDPREPLTLSLTIHEAPTIETWLERLTTQNEKEAVHERPSFINTRRGQ